MEEFKESLFDKLSQIKRAIKKEKDRNILDELSIQLDDILDNYFL